METVTEEKEVTLLGQYINLLTQLRIKRTIRSVNKVDSNLMFKRGKNWYINLEKIKNKSITEKESDVFKFKTLM